MSGTYDIKNQQKKICCLCECPEGYHLLFWECPLFGGETICGECCQLDALKPNIAERFSQRLGRRITLEEVNKACFDCGKNYAKQNPALADSIERGKVGQDDKQTPTG